MGYVKYVFVSGVVENQRWLVLTKLQHHTLMVLISQRCQHKHWCLLKIILK